MFIVALEDKSLSIWGPREIAITQRDHLVMDWNWRYQPQTVLSGAIAEAEIPDFLSTRPSVQVSSEEWRNVRQERR